MLQSFGVMIFWLNYILFMNKQQVSFISMINFYGMTVTKTNQVKEINWLNDLAKLEYSLCLHYNE